MIAFKRYLDSGHSTGAIFTIDAIGAGERQITKPEAGMMDDQPDWSPDGSLLVFHRAPRRPVRDLHGQAGRVGPGAAHPTVLDARPGVETGCEDGAWGSFLPDGKRVVYTRSTGKVRHFPNWDQIQHSDIVVRDVNGANPRVLIRSRPFAGDYESPMFSPDGSQFVYVRANSPLAKPALGARALRRPLPTAAVSGRSRRGRSTPATTPTGLRTES